MDLESEEILCTSAQKSRQEQESGLKCLFISFGWGMEAQYIFVPCTASMYSIDGHSCTASYCTAESFLDHSGLLSSCIHLCLSNMIMPSLRVAWPGGENPVCTARTDALCRISQEAPTNCCTGSQSKRRCHPISHDVGETSWLRAWRIMRRRL